MGTDQPPNPKPSGGIGQYIWAVVFMSVFGVALILGILLLRPQADWVDVTGNVLKGLAPTEAAILALMKAQETHVSVNSRMDAWMAAQALLSHREGVAQGVADEQARMASSVPLMEDKKLLPIA
jgi:hypothetical protein